MKKRILSLFMALTLSLTLLPASAFAESGDGSISGGVIGGNETGGEGGGVIVPPGGSTGEGGGIYVPPGGTTEGGGGTYIPGEDTRKEIWRDTSLSHQIGRSYDGTTDGSTVPINLTFTDGTNVFELKEGTDFTAVKTFDSADAGWHTVTVEITLIGDAAAKYKFKEGEETFTIGGNIDKASPDLTVSLSKTTCTVGEKLLPLLSVDGVKEDAAVTYYYTPIKSGYLEFEDSEAVPKIDENTAISETGTYYVYAKTAETKNYKEKRSTTVELTVAENVVQTAVVIAANGTQSSYASLPEAMNAAQDGDTVKLLTDVDVNNIALTIHRGITFDLNGKKLYSSGEASGYTPILSVEAGSSTVTLKNGTIASDQIYAAAISVWMSGGKLWLENITATAAEGSLNGAVYLGGGGLTATIVSGDYQGLHLDSSATAVLEGGTFRPYIKEDKSAGYSIYHQLSNSGNSSRDCMDLLAKGYGYVDENGNSVRTYGSFNYTVTVQKDTEPPATPVAKIGETMYPSLREAIEAVKSGETIELLDSLDLGSGVVQLEDINKDFTIDLGGKTLQASAQCLVYMMMDKGHVTIQNGTLDGRKCAANAIFVRNYYSGSPRLILKNVTAMSGNKILVVEVVTGGTVEFDGGDYTGGVRIADSGSAVLKNGTFRRGSNTYSISSSSKYLSAYLDSGSLFWQNGLPLDLSSKTETADEVTVHSCEHNWVNGTCTICRKVCDHGMAEDGSMTEATCSTCGMKAAAQVDTTTPDTKYFLTFNEALTCATRDDGCTLKLLADVSLEETTVSISTPFIFDLNGHKVPALSVNAKAKIKDSSMGNGTIGKLRVFNIFDGDGNETVLTFGDLLEEGYAFRHENGTWAKDSDTETLSVTVVKAPIQSVNVFAKDKNNKEVSTIAYGTTGEVTLVACCNLSETSGEKLSCAWYKLTDDTAIPLLEGATDTKYTLPADLSVGRHTYWVTFTSDGYSKSAEITITVTPISLEDATVTVKNPTYNGEKQFPTVTVKLGENTTLTPGTDYSVNVASQTDAGSYTLTVNGMGNYTGEIKDVEWKIEPKTVTNPLINVASCVYNGYEQQPPVELKDGDVVIPKGEYTVEYSNNINAGTATATIKDVEGGNYVVSGGATFTIEQAVIDLSSIQFTQYVFNDLAKTYEIELKTLLDDILSQQRPVGVAYGQIEYPKGVKELHFTDNAYHVDMAVMNGSTLNLPIAAASSSKNTEIGTVTVEIKTTNYQTFDLTIHINAQDKIIPVLAEGSTVSASDITYGQTLSTSKLTVNGKMMCPRTQKEIAGTFAWTKPETKPDAAGDYTASWTFTPDAPEYAPATGTVTVKVNPAQLQNVSVIVPGTYYYTGQPQRATVSAAGFGVRGEQVTFTYSAEENGNYTLQVPEFTDAGTYTVYYKAEVANHNPAVGTFSVQIRPLPISLLSVGPTTKTYDGTASVTLFADMLTFFSRAANRSSITLPATALTISDARFTKLQADKSYADSPEVGVGKALSFTMTLTSGNYVFENKSEDTKMDHCNYATDAVKRFTITKASAPARTTEVMLYVTNGLAKTYEVDLKTLLPELTKPQEYGTVAYGTPIIIMDTGYYDISTAKIENGKLILPILANPVATEGGIGNVTVTVTTTNYEDFTLTIPVFARNKLVPRLDGAVSASDITYGQTLADSELKVNGSMKDNMTTGEEVKGTFTWKDGAIKPDAGSYEAEWIFTPDAPEYAPTTGTVTVTVNKAKQSATLNIAGYTYNEKPSVPTLTNRKGDMEASVTYFYSVAGGTKEKWDVNNPPKLNAGTYKMCAEINGTENYDTFTTAEAEFTVAKAMPSYTKPGDLTAKYGQTLADVTLPTGWSWMNSGESVGDAAAAAKTFKAKFIPTDTNNYNTVENIELEVTVNKADGNNLKMVELMQKYTDTTDHTYAPDWSGLPAGQTWTYSSVGNGSTATLTKQDVAAADGKLTYAISGGKVGDVVTITLKASCDNYEDFTIMLTITLTARDDQAALVITGDTTVVYGEKLTLTTTGGSGTGTVTYRIDEASIGEATIDPNTGVLTPVKVGSVSIIAAKAGDNDYNDVTSAPFVIMITPATPTGEPNYTRITTGGRTLKDAALTLDGSTLNLNAGKLEWIDDNGNVLPDDTRVEANKTYKWRFIPADGNYTTLTGEVELYHVSSGGNGGGSSHYTIKAAAGNGGSISPADNVSVREGRNQTFTITPDTGYAVSDVRIDGKSIGAVDSYTFEKVSGAHTIEVVFSKIDSTPQTDTFVDVTTGSYYKDAVDWAVENGITKGTDATHFSPDGICTRAQAVAFLWRAAGSPKPETDTMPFTDVPVDSYYYNAVLWAVENGIAKGTGDTTFSPDMTCSRAQIVSFLWRAAKSPTAGAENPFTDVSADAYYADAVLWAVKEGITKGTTGTTFSPNADCTRAQIVTFLWHCRK